MKDWVPEKADALAPTPENTEAILREKDEALSLVRGLRADLREALDGIGDIEERFARDMEERYEIFELCVRGFRTIGRLFALLRFAEANGGPRAPLAGRPVSELFEEAVREADETAAEYRIFFASTSWPSAVYQILNAERLAAFRDDAVRRFSAPELSSGPRT